MSTADWVAAILVVVLVVVLAILSRRHEIRLKKDGALLLSIFQKLTGKDDDKA